MNTNISSANFLQIINTHAAMKNILVRMLAKEPNVNFHPAIAKHDDSCPFSKLIKTQKQLFSTLPAFEEAQSLHNNFHGISSEIIRLYEDNQLIESNELLQGRFELISRKLKSKLVLLSQQYFAKLED